jgi:hypothetical protein
LAMGEAMAAYRSALRINPSYGAATVALAKLLHIEKRYEEEEDVLRSTLTHAGFARDSDVRAVGGGREWRDMMVKLVRAHTHSTKGRSADGFFAYTTSYFGFYPDETKDTHTVAYARKGPPPSELTPDPPFLATPHPVRTGRAIRVPRRGQAERDVHADVVRACVSRQGALPRHLARQDGAGERAVQSRAPRGGSGGLPRRARPRATQPRRAEQSGGNSAAERPAAAAGGAGGLRGSAGLAEFGAHTRKKPAVFLRLEINPIKPILPRRVKDQNNQNRKRKEAPTAMS